MIQIFVNANYDFVGKRRWFYLASGGFMLLSILSIVFHGGLNYGIDFTGGTLVQVRYDSYANLLASGVIYRPRLPSFPEPFPGFAPDPR